MRSLLNILCHDDRRAVRVCRERIHGDADVTARVGLRVQGSIAGFLASLIARLLPWPAGAQGGCSPLGKRGRHALVPMPIATSAETAVTLRQAADLLSLQGPYCGPPARGCSTRSV